MIIRNGDIIELWVDGMAYGGYGVARFDGLVIFIKGAIPGDRVLARIVKKKKDYANADLLDLIDPSPDRIPAPCPYSGYCGGCQWQHLKYERQLDYKKEHIRESMERIGLIPEILVHDVIPSDRKFGYRNKMEFSFSDRPWLPPEEFKRGDIVDTFGLGLHIPGTFNKIIDIESCLLQQDRGNLFLREVKRQVKEGGIPVYGLKSHRGFWRFLSLRYSASADGWMINLVTSQERKDVVMPLAEALFQEFGDIKTIVNNINSRRAAIAFGEKEIILAGEGYITDTIGPFKFQISANSFFQTNSSSALKLYKKVEEYAELKGSEIVLDLYCGTGTIPIFLSGSSKEIIGMEITESAIRDANRNSRVNGVDNCRFILGDIRETLSEIKKKPDVLIVDPPRAGIHKDILAEIMRLKTERLVYVSCNPTTMARDVARMMDYYDLIEIQPVDMFPHTYHIEAVAKMLLRE